MVTNDLSKYDAALITQKLNGSTDFQKLREIMEEVIPNFKQLGIDQPELQSDLIQSMGDSLKF
jgi:hypothetical protein